MIDIPPGTFVEVYWTKIVSEVMVVEGSNPLILRKATAWERFRLYFKTRKAKAGEMAAAAEAIDAIQSARMKV